MLYQIYDSQRSLIEPFADLAKTASKLFSNPQTPWGLTPLAQRISAGYDLFYRLGKDYVKPEFGLRSVDVDGVEVAIHERVEIRKPFCELRRFKRYSDDVATLDKLKNQPVVLVVAPLSGHYATLLRDTVKTMLGDHKVYITDWTNARLVPQDSGEFHLDDYINYVQEFIRYLQKSYGNCHVLSVCQPTVPVLAAISLMASRGETTPLSMTKMGGPIDARKSPTAVNDLATQRSIEWFENNVIYRVPSGFPGAGRRVYPGFLQHTGFVAMNPDRHMNSHYDYFKDLVKGDMSSTTSHRKFYDEYNAVLDMDADYYLETIQVVFREFRLPNNTWDVISPEGTPERVRPQDITTTALLSVEGELDDISGLGQTEAARALCCNIPDTLCDHLEVKGAGHYGIFSGRRWREVVYPVLRNFIVQHNTAQGTGTANPVKAAPQRVTATATAKVEAVAAVAASVASAAPTAVPAPVVASAVEVVAPVTEVAAPAAAVVPAPTPAPAVLPVPAPTAAPTTVVISASQAPAAPMSRKEKRAKGKTKMAAPAKLLVQTNGQAAGTAVAAVAQDGTPPKA